MKINKFIFILILLTSSWTLFGQINPINNLNYQQTYMFGNYNCPSFNCFTLEWSPPEISYDTLLGYNVYRNNDFWIFTNDTFVSCSGYYPCEHDDFYDPLPFWITIKSIYNIDSLESIVNDSVKVADLMINIKEAKGNEIVLVKNPISVNENISLLLPNLMQSSCTIKIYSLSGQELKHLEFKQGTENNISFSTSNLNRGLFIIRIQLNNNIITKKIVIQ